MSEFFCYLIADFLLCFINIKSSCMRPVGSRIKQSIAVYFYVIMSRTISISKKSTFNIRSYDQPISNVAENM